MEGLEIDLDLVARDEEVAIEIRNLKPRTARFVLIMATYPDLQPSDAAQMAGYTARYGAQLVRAQETIITRVRPRVRELVEASRALSMSKKALEAAGRALVGHDKPRAEVRELLRSGINAADANDVDRRFVEAWVGEHNGDHAAAALAAGLVLGIDAETVEGCTPAQRQRLAKAGRARLKRPAVQSLAHAYGESAVVKFLETDAGADAIKAAELRATRLAAASSVRADLIATLYEVSQTSVRDVMTWGEGGEGLVLRASDQLSDAAAQRIVSIEMSPPVYSDGVEVSGPTLKKVTILKSTEIYAQLAAMLRMEAPPAQGANVNVGVGVKIDQANTFGPATDQTHGILESVAVKLLGVRPAVAASDPDNIAISEVRAVLAAWGADPDRPVEDPAMLFDRDRWASTAARYLQG